MFVLFSRQIEWMRELTRHLNYNCKAFVLLNVDVSHNSKTIVVGKLKSGTKPGIISKRSSSRFIFLLTLFFVFFAGKPTSPFQNPNRTKKKGQIKANATEMNSKISRAYLWAVSTHLHTEQHLNLSSFLVYGTLNLSRDTRRACSLFMIKSYLSPRDEICKVVT